MSIVQGAAAAAAADDDEKEGGNEEKEGGNKDHRRVVKEGQVHLTETSISGPLHGSFHHPDGASVGCRAPSAS